MAHVLFVILMFLRIWCAEITIQKYFISNIKVGDDHSGSFKVSLKDDATEVAIQGTDENTYLYSISSLDNIKTRTTSQDYSAVSWQPVSDRICTLTENGVILIYDSSGGNILTNDQLDDYPSYYDIPEDYNNVYSCQNFVTFGGQYHINVYNNTNKIFSITAEVSYGFKKRGYCPFCHPPPPPPPPPRIPQQEFVSIAVNSKFLFVADSKEHEVKVYEYVGGKNPTYDTPPTTLSKSGSNSFGNSMAATDNYLFVGAPDTTGSFNDKGYVYIYTMSFYSPLNLQPLDIKNGDRYGTNIAVSPGGKLLVVTSPGKKIESTTGAAYVYYHSDATSLWTQHTVLSYYGVGTINSVSISETSMGYIVVFGMRNENPGVVVFNVSCATTKNYGIMCDIPCTCKYGDCFESLWGTNGTCLKCNSDNVYGSNCDNNCSCVHGVCSSGISGSGKCISCNKNWYGNLCQSNCTCLHGVCNDSMNGNGLCKSCDINYYGINCELKCGICNGTCFSGIYGNGSCSNCTTNKFGDHCDPCLCNTTHGICSDGPLGTGLCLSCFSNYYGDYCDKECTCKNGTCNLSNGMCLNCNYSYYGPNCDKKSPCEYGTPNWGLDGNGTCLSCISGYFGPYCNKSCTCSGNGVCNDGIDGNGLCLSCNNISVYGVNCDKLCPCENGLCNSTISDDAGNCFYCSPNYYGKYCDKLCSCTNGTCNDGVNGDGSCLECNPFFFGENCTQCPCQYGICNDNINGTGQCTECDPNFAGINCDIMCNCTYGNCSSGIQGDGSCIFCETNYFGKNCTQCLCVNGKCDEGLNGTGYCKACNDGFMLDNSNRYCTACPEGTNCFNNGSIVISSLVLGVEGVINFNGDVVFLYSNLTLSTSSSINVTDCPSIINSTLTVKDDGKHANETSYDITLFTYGGNNCSLNFNKINFETQNPCQTASLQRKPNTYAFIITVTYNDHGCDATFPLWAILAISLGLAFVLTIISMIVFTKCRRLRQEAFPWRDHRVLSRITMPHEE